MVIQHALGEVPPCVIVWQSRQEQGFLDLEVAIDVLEYEIGEEHCGGPNGSLIGSGEGARHHECVVVVAREWGKCFATFHRS